ncbi:Protein of unknown function [Bacillus wiedmannii]|uniref:Uncharacterized protein n=1 Tax=Bacillus wiedmannii TaxID=1890302 RepID=A0A1C4DJW6_9BACI|nr:Protein of unknown function [Bacillus wiedmannii]SCL97391.1 Protein of unknown function [Bacillus wiedmannii]
MSWMFRLKIYDVEKK